MFLLGQESKPSFLSSDSSVSKLHLYRTWKKCYKFKTQLFLPIHRFSSLEMGYWRLPLLSTYFQASPHQVALHLHIDPHPFCCLHYAPLTILEIWNVTKDILQIFPYQVWKKKSLLREWTSISFTNITSSFLKSTNMHKTSSLWSKTSQSSHEQWWHSTPSTPTCPISSLLSWGWMNPKPGQLTPMLMMLDFWVKKQMVETGVFENQTLPQKNRKHCIAYHK